MSAERGTETGPDPFVFGRFDHHALFEKATQRAKRLARRVEEINLNADSLLDDVGRRASDAVDRWLGQVGLMRKSRHEEELQQLTKNGHSDHRRKKRKAKKRVVRKHRKS